MTQEHKVFDWVSCLGCGTGGWLDYNEPMLNSGWRSKSMLNKNDDEIRFYLCSACDCRNCSSVLIEEEFNEDGSSYPVESCENEDGCKYLHEQHKLLYERIRDFITPYVEFYPLKSSPYEEEIIRGICEILGVKF